VPLFDYLAVFMKKLMTCFQKKYEFYNIFCRHVHKIDLWFVAKKNIHHSRKSGGCL